MFTDMATRRYQKKRRAEQEAETRQRIVEAMVALHREVGPARTTISAIAERAGVERLTVYRHFPDERSMFQACTSHYSTLVPEPDAAAWADIAEPAERLRAATRILRLLPPRGGRADACCSRRAAAPRTRRGAQAVGGVRGRSPRGSARGMEAR